MRQRPTMTLAKSRRAVQNSTLALATLLVAQGAVASEAGSYERAARVFDPNLAPSLLNATIKPTWVGAEDSFWYRRQLPTGGEYRLVDLDKRSSLPAFDHERLAAAASAVGLASTPTSLSVSALERVSDGFKVILESKGARATCQTATYECAFAKVAPAVGIVSPDGLREVIARNHNLWVRTLATGELSQLTHDGVERYAYGRLADSSLAAIPSRKFASERPFGISWSPDGQYVLGGRVDERSTGSLPFVEWVPADGSLRPIYHDIRQALPGDEYRPRTEVFAINVATGKRQIFQAAPGISIGAPNLGWSPDNRRAYALGLGGAGGRVAALLELDVETGSVRQLIREEARTRIQFNSFVYSASNVRVLDGGRSALWWSERDGWGHLYLYDTAAGRVRRQLTQGPWLVRDIVHVDERQQIVYFTASGHDRRIDPYYRQLFRVSLAGGPVVRLTNEAAEHEIDGASGFAPRPSAGLSGSNAISPSGRYVLDTFSTVDTPPLTVARLTSDGRQVMTIERADASRVMETGWRPPTRLKVKAADGTTDIYATVYQPSGPVPAGGYPVINALYAGPQSVSAPRSFSEAVNSPVPVGRASLAQLGFAVITVDGRGTPGRSRAFRDVGYGNFADRQIEDHITAIKQIGAQLGSLNLKRVGVYGHSFGGYMAARSLLARGDFYSVGISSAGPQNFHMLYDIMQGYIGPVNYGGGQTVRPTPNAVPENYRILDNTALAAQLKGDLLLAYGDLDENVPPSTTLVLADALNKAGKTYDLVYLPNRTHAFFRTDAYFLKRSWDYFIERLAGRQPPDAPLPAMVN